MADFINKVVKEYRAQKPDEHEEGDVKPTIKNIVENSESKKEDDKIKIRAYFKDCPHIVYMAKTQRKFKKDDLCRIKEELFFSKYNVDTTIQEIRKVLKEELDVFDVDAYEKERGIIKKV